MIVITRIIGQSRHATCDITRPVEARTPPSLIALTKYGFIYTILYFDLYLGIKNAKLKIKNYRSELLTSNFALCIIECAIF